MISVSYSNGIWTYAEDIRAGVFGEREVLQHENFTFNNIVYFNRNIFANENITVQGDILGTRFLSVDDSNFFINPSQISVFNEIRAQRIISTVDSNFFIIPSQTSTLNILNLEGNLNLNNNNIINVQEIEVDNICNSQGDCITVEQIQAATLPPRIWVGQSGARFRQGYQNLMDTDMQVHINIPRGQTGSRVYVSHDGNQWRGFTSGTRHSRVAYTVTVPPGGWYAYSDSPSNIRTGSLRTSSSSRDPSFRIFKEIGGEILFYNVLP